MKVYTTKGQVHRRIRTLAKLADLVEIPEVGFTRIEKER